MPDATTGKHMPPHVSVPPNADETYRNEAWLRQKLINEQLSLRETAELAQISRQTIKNYADRFGIDLPDPAVALARKVHGDLSERPYNDRRWLYHQYVRLGKSDAEIAESIGVTAPTIHNARKKHGIAAIPKVPKVTAPYADEEWLIAQLEEHGSIPVVAEVTGYDPTTLWRWARTHRIDLAEYRDRHEKA